LRVLLLGKEEIWHNPLLFEEGWPKAGVVHSVLMSIAIIADIHDNAPILLNFLGWCREKEILELIICGDLGNTDTLGLLGKNFIGKIFFVRGNADNFSDEDFKKYINIKHYGAVGRFEIKGRTVGICHQPRLIEKVLELGKCDYIFYGHTHKPWMHEHASGAICVNPGTLGGMFSGNTYAVMDSESGKVELRSLQ
jgi:putative phosphoesterase